MRENGIVYGTKLFICLQVGFNRHTTTVYGALHILWYNQVAIVNISTFTH